MARVILILIPIILLFLLAFVIGKHNAQEVSLNLLVVERTFSVASILGVTLAIGFVLGLLTVSLGYWRLKWQVRRLKKALVKSAGAK
ncbi:lipopolysaccharide assembly protein LapA domain-containing protein [Aliidiomarina indica]|uniref:lipopolysaccharide assembly protein LapA domain-containing protein n=1 Tax=Aliidiomarina indica TaxID=2749147 RepID=UPI0018904F57|nr:LapA family protein [Aliidiomarina indica]